MIIVTGIIHVPEPKAAAILPSVFRAIVCLHRLLLLNKKVVVKHFEAKNLVIQNLGCYREDSPHDDTLPVVLCAFIFTLCHL